MNEKLTFSDLRNANLTRCEESFHPLDHWNLAEWGNACAGEVGEACNVAKKLRRLEDSEGYKATLPKADAAIEDLADELADIVIYADLWAARAGISLEEAVRRKFDRTSDKVQSDVKLGAA